MVFLNTLPKCATTLYASRCSSPPLSFFFFPPLWASTGPPTPCRVTPEPCGKQNLVKGYISHKAKFLVVASTVEKAFPKISLVA